MVPPRRADRGCGNLALGRNVSPRMTRRLALLATVLVLPLLSAGARQVRLPASLIFAVTISPTSGPAGTTIHVTGANCPTTGWDTSLHWSVHVQILQGNSAPTPSTITQPSGTPMTPLAFASVGYPGAAEADTTRLRTERGRSTSPSRMAARPRCYREPSRARTRSRALATRPRALRPGLSCSLRSLSRCQKRHRLRLPSQPHPCSLADRRHRHRASAKAQRPFT